jgi:hypothetical protein
MQLVAIALGYGGTVSLCVLALAAIGVWRWLDRRASTLAVPVRTIRLTHQHSLHVVDLNDERLVVGTGPSAAPRLVLRERQTDRARSGRDPWTPS